MKNKMAIIAGLILILPILISAAGWNPYLCFTIGTRDFVLGTNNGISHIETGSHIDRNFGRIVEDYGYLVKHLIAAGPLQIWAEKRLDPMQFWYFSLISPHKYSDYRGIDMPAILPPAFLFAFPVIAFIKRKNRA